MYKYNTSPSYFISTNKTIDCNSSISNLIKEKHKYNKLISDELSSSHSNKYIINNYKSELERIDNILTYLRNNCRYN